MGGSEQWRGVIRDAAAIDVCDFCCCWYLSTNAGSSDSIKALHAVIVVFWVFVFVGLSCSNCLAVTPSAASGQKVRAAVAGDMTKKTGQYTY